MAVVLPSFPRELEAEFQAFYYLSSRSIVRIGIIVGIFVFLAFGLWDWITAPTVITYSLAIRLVAGLILGVLWWQIESQKSPVVMQRLIGSGAAMTGLCVVWIIYLMRGAPTLGVAGVLLVLMFIFGFLRLLFVPSMIASLLIIIAYNVSAIASEFPLKVVIANNSFLASGLLAGGTITYTLEKLFRRQFVSERNLEIERAKTDALLDNMLPRHIATRLKGGEKIIAESHGEATVLFADMIGFTSLTRRLSPGHLIELLNEIFSTFDKLAEQHGVEKVKTIGDAYMAVSGVNGEQSQSVEAIANFALDMRREVERYAQINDYPIAMRIGIATGQVISGVIGLRRFAFDLWGDTVNLASRMESSSERGSIQVTETTFWRLRQKYDLQHKGKIELKGIGPVETYLLLGRRETAASVAPGGLIPEPADQMKVVP